MERITLIILALTTSFFVFIEIRRIVLKRKKAKRMEMEMKGYLTEKNQDFPLVKIHTDRDGNNWYAFKNPIRMPAIRTISGEAAARQSELNMDRDTLERYLIDMEQLAEKGKIVDLFKHIAIMKDRLNWAFEEKTLLNLASIFFLMEGEDPTRISDEFVEKKKAIMNSDIETKAFFLTAAYNYSRTTGDISESDTLRYLMERER